MRFSATYRMACAECGGGSVCFGHRTELPTHSQLMASAAYNAPLPSGMNETEAERVKSYHGYWPQYVGGPRHGERADASHAVSLIGREDRKSDDDYYQRPGVHHFYHISYLADPRLWERLLDEYMRREIADRQRLVRDQLAREHAAKKAADVPVKARRGRRK